MAFHFPEVRHPGSFSNKTEAFVVALGETVVGSFPVGRVGTEAPEAARAAAAEFAVALLVEQGAKEEQVAFYAACNGVKL